MYADLHVITAVANPSRWRSRYYLFKAFENHMLESGVKLHVVEAAFGERPFVVTNANNPQHVQLRTGHELWLKENLLNIGFSRLPADWKYAAWIDADLTFVDPYWAEHTIQKLQHYPIIQLFSEAHDLAPDNTIMQSFRSLGWSHVHHIPWPAKDHYYGAGAPKYGKYVYMHHPGFAYAIRRDAFNSLGGLLDIAILGEADYIMARGLVGECEKAVYPGVHPAYLDACFTWQTRALEHIKRNFGYLDGAILHHWHGPKANRKYWDRCKILQQYQFNPLNDIKRDYQGLWQLEERCWQLRDAIREYFAQRDEDAELIHL